jgi:hypothetical protein
VRRIGRPFATIPLVLVGLSLLVLFGLRVYWGRDAEDRIDEADVVEFTALVPAATPNRFLMCPPRLCNIPADAESPVFAIGWERLRTDWSEIVAHQPRVKLIGGDGELQKITYIAHSPVLNLPTIVTIEFFPVGEHGSSFAIESHSRYGMFDFGGNRAQALAWVGFLKKMAKPAAVS